MCEVVGSAFTEQVMRMCAGLVDSEAEEHIELQYVKEPMAYGVENVVLLRLDYKDRYVSLWAEDDELIWLEFGAGGFAGATETTPDWYPPILSANLAAFLLGVTEGIPVRRFGRKYLRLPANPALRITLFPPSGPCLPWYMRNNG